MKYLATVALLTALCWGCVLPTVHPLFTDADLVFVPALLGTWSAEGDETTWSFARGEGKRYRVTVADETQTGVFVGHLAKLGEHRFLDIVPDADDVAAKSMVGDFLLPLHLFARVDAIGTTVEIAAIDPQWVRKRLETQPDALAHTKYKDGILITAATPELRAFVIAHAEDPAAFRKLPPYRKVGLTKTLPPYAPEGAQ